VSLRIMGESTARIWRSVYESQEHSIMATLATQQRQFATAETAGAFPTVLTRAPGA